VASSPDNGYINLYLGELKRPWVAHCQSLGYKPGAAIREAVAAALAEATEGEAVGDSQRRGSPKPMKTASEDKPQGRKVRRWVRLWPSEDEAIAKRAEEEGCSWQVWVVAVLRGCLTRQAQVGMKEFDLLGTSNYQLAAIGRNLNQIARRVNDGYDAEMLTRERIEALTKLINQHTRRVSRVMGASIERWNFDL